jgi:hypothetical protein
LPTPSISPRLGLPALSIIVVTLAGLVLRLFAARGELWLDEIWSLQNLEKIHSVGDIFWGMSQDNNHFLNSLWLWIVGPHALPLIIRLEALVCGALTIPVAAQLCRRAGDEAGFAAAAIVAGAPLFVHYGSEARGYAGLILMTFIAAEAAERFLDSFADIDTDASRANAQKSRLVFGIAVAIGALFHLTMLMAAAALFVAALLRLAMRGFPLAKVARAAIDLAIPAALGATPAIGFMVAGVLNTHKLELGAQIPFSLDHLGQGLSTLFEATLGLPFGLPVWAALAITVILVSCALAITPADRRILPLTALCLPPLLAALAHLPNVHIARFHLISALGLVLLMAELFSWLWRSHYRPQWAILLASAFCIGSAIDLAPLLLHGRGDYQKLIRRMETHGPTTYGSNMEAELNRTLRFYDPRLGKLLVSAKSVDWCKTPPAWYILSDDPGGEAPQRNFGPPECGVPYIRDVVISATPLSGLRLALYARQD